MAESNYQNPVYPRSFPDPFVLRHGGEYFAFCTGHAADGRVFGVLRSVDLVHWDELPGAMEPLAAGTAAGELYWAPEVTHHEGKFYLYYSVGNEKLMEIRVATGDSPGGPYADTGHTLTCQEFAIDPHVFIDDDGSWHLFYATDFLEHTHIGTGTVVDRMLDPFTLAGEPRPVTRAKYDWQVYDPARPEKGGVRWHTVEGPFVLKRKGRYFEMFSGGNWQNISYGVGYAVSDTLYRDDEWPQQVDGSDTLPLLHTKPERVIGPGHNSVVVGPNGREIYCVYHRWEHGERVMCIDRMDFAGGDRMFVVGPSYDPQPAPFSATTNSFEESFTEADLSARGWTVTGNTAHDVDGVLLAGDGVAAELSRPVNAADLELAVNVRLSNSSGDEPSVVFTCAISTVLHQTVDGWVLTLDSDSVILPDNFEPAVFHQYRVLKLGNKVQIYVDGDELGRGTTSRRADRISVTVRHASAVLDMVRFTLL